MTDGLAYAPLISPDMLRRPPTLRFFPTSHVGSSRRKGQACLPTRHFTARVADSHDVSMNAPDLSFAKCRILDIHAPVPYPEAWEIQHGLVDEMKKDCNVPDSLVLLQHEPVYTLGTASKLDHVLFDAEELRRGQKLQRSETPLLVRTERGGEVTYHGPGQLVAYPILNLTRHKKDLHWYLRSLEQVVIDMVKRFYGLEAGRKKGLTGVWVGDEKICAFGLKVSKWITMHGLALNVSTDLSPFERIVPCGVSEHGVSSLHLLARENDVSIEEAKGQLVESFDRIFGPYELTKGRNVLKEERTE